MNEYGVPNKVKYGILAALVVGLVAARMMSGDRPLSLPTPDQQTADEAKKSAASRPGPSADALLQLKKIDEKVGSGPAAKAGDTVDMLYTGTLDDGTVFDSTSKRHDEPFSFTLGSGQVIQGWELGIPGMKVGGKRKLVIPAELGYGAQGQGSIPANSQLTFEVELKKITPAVGPMQPAPKHP